MIIGGMSALVLLTACSNTETGEQSNMQSTKKLETRVVDGLSLEVKQKPNTPIIEKNGKKTKTLLTFSVKGTNITPFPKGLGATDFSLKTKEGKKVPISENMSAFGDEILTGKSLSGEVYFEVPNKAVGGTLQYKLKNKVISEWKLAK